MVRRPNNSPPGPFRLVFSPCCSLVRAESILKPKRVGKSAEILRKTSDFSRSAGHRPFDMSDSSDSGCPRGVWSDSSSDSDDGPSLRQRRDAWADRIDALRAACETTTSTPWYNNPKKKKRKSDPRRQTKLPQIDTNIQNEVDPEIKTNLSKNKKAFRKYKKAV